MSPSIFDITAWAGALLAFETADLLLALVALLVGACVAGITATIMAQRGRSAITPEREIALAVGHADRRTVFESPVLQPLMWMMLGAARWLPAASSKRWIRRTLVAAGSPNFYTPDEFLALAMLVGLGLTVAAELLVFVFSGVDMTWRSPMVTFGVIFPAGVAGTLYYLSGLASKRMRHVSRRIPYTLDLIALAMGAGATFTEAVRTVIREDPAHPFNVELSTVLAEIDLGTTRAQALRNMTDRIPLEGLRSIIAAVVQAESLGTPLTDVLKQQANLLRLQRSVRAEVQAAAASVRILLPSTLILISVVLTIFATVIIRAIKGQLF